MEPQTWKPVGYGVSANLSAPFPPLVFLFFEGVSECLTQWLVIIFTYGSNQWCLLLLLWSDTCGVTLCFKKRRVGNAVGRPRLQVACFLTNFITTWMSSNITTDYHLAFPFLHIQFPQNTLISYNCVVRLRVYDIRPKYFNVRTRASEFWICNWLAKNL